MLSTRMFLISVSLIGSNTLVLIIHHTSATHIFICMSITRESTYPPVLHSTVPLHWIHIPWVHQTLSHRCKVLACETKINNNFVYLKYILLRKQGRLWWSGCTSHCWSTFWATHSCLLLKFNNNGHDCFTCRVDYVSVHVPTARVATVSTYEWKRLYMMKRKMTFSATFARSSVSLITADKPKRREVNIEPMCLANL